ncbi:hypothetical protein [Runella limosa]|uniref:hypothetical protein n=1 Tax=Runella limosa TaxID=370978 RepID=UPI000411D6F7|nr:hypothetical protein [Runella limosa]
MNSQLTKEQINLLHTHVADRGVEYFDVQVELVDHLASRIEEELDQYSEKSTDEVFKRTLKTFKKRDLKQVVKEKEKQVGRLYRRYWKESCKDFFMGSKIFFTMVLIGVLYIFLRKAPIELVKTVNENSLLPCFSLAIGYSIFVYFRNVAMSRKLSFTDYRGIGTGIIIINFYYMAKLTLKFTMLGESTYPLVTALLISAIFLLGVAEIQAYEKMRAYGRQLYPQAFKSVPKLV